MAEHISPVNIRYRKATAFAVLLCVSMCTTLYYEHTNNISLMSFQFFQTKGFQQAAFTKYNVSSICRLMFKQEYLRFWKPVSQDTNIDHMHVTHSRQNCTPKEEKLIVIVNAQRWFKPLKNLTGYCTCNNCQVSFDRRLIPTADAVVFQVKNLHGNTPQRPTGQPWIFMGWESPVHLSFRPTDNWKRAFNYTMTYRTDSDLFSPVGMFVPASKSPDFDRLKEATIKKTRTAAWFVSNCHTQSKREVYVKRMQKVIDIDIYGRCTNKRCGTNTQCLDMLSKHYKFYLSFENSLCKDYVTEKLYKTYNVTSLAVVRGGANYASLVPTGTYINAGDFSSPELLAKQLLHLSKNDTAYLELLVEKERFRAFGSLDMKRMAFCELCYSLNNQGYKVKQYANVDGWLRDNICHTPDDL